MIIYKATNRINGKVYIGQTKHSLEHRKNSHERDTRCRKKHSTYFHEALAKYGYENFVWEVIDESNSQVEIDKLEKKYIQEYRSMDKEFGYNLKDGGKEGGIYNEEGKRRLGESTKKKWANPETAAKMREGLRKGTETVKKNAENFWEIRVCKHCGKEFKVKPHWKKQYCSQECVLAGEHDTWKKCIQYATQINIESYEKERESKCYKVYEWLRNNIEIIKNAKFNKLTFIKDLNKFIGVTDDRTSAKVVGCSYRRDFVKFLQKCIPILNIDGDCLKCGHAMIENNGYIICPTCGYSYKININ